MTGFWFRWRQDGLRCQKRLNGTHQLCCYITSASHIWWLKASFGSTKSTESTALFTTFLHVPNNLLVFQNLKPSCLELWQSFSSRFPQPSAAAVYQADGGRVSPHSMQPHRYGAFRALDPRMERRFHQPLHTKKLHVCSSWKCWDIWKQFWNLSIRYIKLTNVLCKARSPSHELADLESWAHRAASFSSFFLQYIYRYFQYVVPISLRWLKTALGKHLKSSNVMYAIIAEKLS